MNKQLTQQTSCRSCSSKKLKDVISLGKISLSEFNKHTSSQKYPLQLFLCENCSLLQLKHTVSQSLLYNNDYGYKSGINKTMQDELKNIVKESITTLATNKQDFLAIDIGANDGTLLKYYPKKVVKIGVEPITKYAKECQQYADIVINDFFNFESYQKKVGAKTAHIVTAISCFYDMKDPNRFLNDIKRILHKKGILVIQQNYLVNMLLNNAFDNIVHEHLEYYSFCSLERLLEQHNLEIFDVTLTPLNGGSIRTFISHKNARSIVNSVYEIREREKLMQLKKNKTYTDFARRIKDIREKTHNFILSEVKNGKKIFVYGASTRGNTLLQYFKLDNSLITKAVDRNSEKWGKTMTALRIPIISEEQAREEKPDYMIVLPWFFKEEFLNREKEYLEHGGKFIFPLPHFEIIGASSQ